MANYFIDQIIAQQKSGKAIGVTSICSAHAWVLAAAMQSAAHKGSTLLVEATCNQVNQFGGYTGMTPTAFVAFVEKLAQINGLPRERLLLGGDHLGPNVWQNEPAARAMEKAIDMVQAYVQAGFQKIHLDASMKLGGDDTSVPLDVEIAAQRAAQLAKTAEQALHPEAMNSLRYVIGTEVPVPGGVAGPEEGLVITTAANVRQTIDITRNYFRKEGIESAWEDVVAVVVQPGVEFSSDSIHDYQPEKAKALSRFIEGEQNLIYEAHSTDYQTRESLRNLVRDHFAILKVGPGLTFAFREIVFALAIIEQELFSEEEQSKLISVLDETMRSDPRYWKNYYPGTEREQAFARKYSLSDRIRYYWSEPMVERAFQRMLLNLQNVQIPISLISQFLPQQVDLIRSGEFQNSPDQMILNGIKKVLSDYEGASEVVE